MSIRADSRAAAALPRRSAWALLAACGGGGGSAASRHDRVLAVGLRPAARLPEVRRRVRRQQNPGLTDQHLAVRLGRLLVQAHRRVHRRHRAGRVHRPPVQVRPVRRPQGAAPAGRPRPDQRHPATATTRRAWPSCGRARTASATAPRRTGTPSRCSTTTTALQAAGVDPAAAAEPRPGTRRTAARSRSWSPT